MKNSSRSLHPLLTLAFYLDLQGNRGNKGGGFIMGCPLLQAAAWWMFLSGIVSLGCAYLGGRIGVRAAEHSIKEKGAQRAA